MCWCSTRNFCIQYFCWAAFFFKDFFPFFGGIFFWSCCGRLPSGSCLQNDSCFSASWPPASAHLLSFLPFLLPSFLPFPSLPSFLPSFLSSFLHHISKARIANSHKSKKQQKPTEAFESQHKSPKANRSQQKPTEASNSYQKPLKATRSQQKPPEATKIPQKPTKATKSE